MEIDINNLTDFKVDISFLKEIVKKILKEEGEKNFNVSIALVNEETIRKINKKYRKKDKATDVLSFVHSELDNFCGDEMLGEIIICPFQVGKRKKEIVKVLIHGIFHLLGYDHEKNIKEAEVMRKKEEEYVFFFSN